MEVNRDEVAGNITLLYQRLQAMGIGNPLDVVAHAEKQGWIKRGARPKTTWQNLINQDIASRLTPQMHVVD